MHIILGILSLIKVFTPFPEVFPSSYKSIQLLAVLTEALNFCKML